MRLYGYWRSGTSHRVRLALGFKGLTVDHVPIDLRQGAHRTPAYTEMNPSALVPTLELDDGTAISQSTAIIEFLDEAFPDPALLPGSSAQRAHARQLAQIIACDTHPLQNLRVQKFLRQELRQDDPAVAGWLQRFIGDGLAAYETLTARVSGDGPFSLGAQFSYPDCFVVPQLYAARRFNVPTDGFPTLLRIEAACAEVPFVQAAAPEAQPDAD